MFDVDPVGKENRLLSELRQWVVGNIRECDIDLGETIVDFMPSSPPIDTGYHRYVFLIYQHPHEIQFEEPFIRSK